MPIHITKTMMEKIVPSESISKANVKPKGPVPMTDFESKVIAELNQERFSQSVTIANQLATIGKLKASLGQLMGKSSRYTPHSTGLFLPSTLATSHVSECSEVGMQTDFVISDEIVDLRTQVRFLESTLSVEREKARRVVEACTRIASPVLSSSMGISSQALAKWVAMGLEESKTLTRSSRTSTFDDTFFPVVRYPSLVVSTVASVCLRRTLSEGDMPADGLDLDMMYGSFGENETALKESGRYVIYDMDDEDIPDVVVLPGTYFNGTTIVFYDGKNCMQFDQDTEITEWGTLGWVRIESELIKNLLAGSWSTAFTFINIITDMNSGKCSGQWGGRQVELFLYESNSIVARLVSLEDASIDNNCMYGTLLGNRILWGNGQTWIRQ